MPPKKPRKPRKRNPSAPVTRTKIFLVRATPGEHQAMVEAARESHRALSDYCRLAALHCLETKVRL